MEGLVVRSKQRVTLRDDRGFEAAKFFHAVSFEEEGEEESIAVVGEDEEEEAEAPPGVPARC